MDGASSKVDESVEWCHDMVSVRPYHQVDDEMSDGDSHLKKMSCVRNADSCNELIFHKDEKRC